MKKTVSKKQGKEKKGVRVFYDWDARKQRMIKTERPLTAAEERLERKAEALKALTDFRDASPYARRQMLLRKVSDEARELFEDQEARIARLEEALVRAVEVLSSVRAEVSRARR